jgi:hypothetical protein
MQRRIKLASTGFMFFDSAIQSKGDAMLQTHMKDSSLYLPVITSTAIQINVATTLMLQTHVQSSS